MTPMQNQDREGASGDPDAREWDTGGSHLHGRPFDDDRLKASQSRCTAKSNGSKSLCQKKLRQVTPRREKCQRDPIR